MTDKVKMICSKCSHTIEVFESEAMDFTECCLCGSSMLLDMNKGKKMEEPTGDNFPLIIDKEREMLDSFGTLGMGHTWYFIENIIDVKLRLQYRKTFFACGGQIPEREEIND